VMPSHYIELEPEVQVGIFVSISGFPRGWTCTTMLIKDPPFNILSAQVTTSMITSMTEDTQTHITISLFN